MRRALWYLSTAVGRKGALLRASLSLICVAVILALGVHEFHPSSTFSMSGVPVPPVMVVPNHHVEEPTAPITPISQLGSSLFPVLDPANDHSWISANHRMLQSLLHCLEHASCKPNQNKIVILDSYHFRGAFWGWNGGEDIWARSTLLALQNLGYTYLYSLNLERTILLYQMFPSLVKAVIMEDGQAHQCFEDTEFCVLSEGNPHGIPAWKIFSFYFWTGPSNGLGAQWTLNPEDYSLEGFSPNQYLGYSIEPACSMREFVPHSERSDHAYVMTKKSSYFADNAERAWAPELYELAAKETGIQFLVGARDDSDENDGVPTPIPEVLHNLGLIDQPQFIEAMSHAKVLVGVGRPVTSPTPYEALCLGVPFINPIISWDHDHPHDRTKWSAQHGQLKLLDPPYVYNVFKDDAEGFVEAIKEALAHPIESYVLERMQMTSVEGRLEAILEKDWQSVAADLLAHRKETRDGPLFTL